LGSFRKIELDAQGVLQADGLKDTSQFVEVIGPAVKHPQIEI